MAYTYYQLPVSIDFPWYSFVTTLTSSIYTIHMRYNSRMQRWIMDIADSQDNDLVDGVPILIERNLVGRFATAGLPGGMFYASDDTGQGTQPTRSSLGVDHSLIYVEGV